MGYYVRGLLHPEFLSEIDPPDFWIIGQLLRRSGSEELALTDDISSIGNRQRFTHIVICDQDPDPTRPQPGDYLLQILDRDRVDTGKWFVEQNILWLDRQHARDLRPSSLTSGERIAMITSDVAESKFVQQLFEPLFSLTGIELQCLENGEDILFNGQLAKDRRLLWKIADSKPCAAIKGGAG